MKAGTDLGERTFLANKAIKMNHPSSIKARNAARAAGQRKDWTPEAYNNGADILHKVWAATVPSGPTGAYDPVYNEGQYTTNNVCAMGRLFAGSPSTCTDQRCQSMRDHTKPAQLLPIEDRELVFDRADQMLTAMGVKLD